MEKYVKLEDINIMLSKMYKEPRYQHEDEDFYSGVSQVACNLMYVPTIKLEEPKVGKWIFNKWAGQEYYKCSCCGKDYPLPPTWNAYDINKYLNYCSACGARMKVE